VNRDISNELIFSIRARSCGHNSVRTLRTTYVSRSMNGTLCVSGTALIKGLRQPTGHLLARGEPYR